MTVKVGDLIEKRYVIKEIMLDPNKDLKEPVFILFDKKEKTYIDYDRDKMMKLLKIKESE